MDIDVLQEKQQSRAGTAGAWKLESTRALTLAPRRDGLLRVARGQLWATFDGPHPPLGVRSGDLVVGEGETLFVARGERLVIEPARRSEDAYFWWDPLPRAQAVPLERWRALAAPWRDLRGALAATAAASGRLVTALVAAALASLPRRLPGSRVAA